MITVKVRLRVAKPVVLIAEELSPATLDALGPDFEIRNCDGANRAELLPALAARFANALPMNPHPPVTSIERWFLLAGMLKAKSPCQEVAVCFPRPQQARVSRHRELVR